MCGEKPSNERSAFIRKGSPPRVRGKVLVCKIFQMANGITPACAGKRTGTSRPVRFTADHPRVCGEKPPPTKKSCRSKGSPPRVRGKVGVLFLRAVITGITPACAGKRALTACSTSAYGDHPRVCGEKDDYHLTIELYQGSPPRVRGKAWRTTSHAASIRITPACAGKRPNPSAYRPRTRDHPRVCGEKSDSHGHGGA